MIMRQVKYLSIIILLALSNGAASGEFDSITITKPFGTPLSALNLKIYYKERFGKDLTDDEVLAFQSIDRIQYEIRQDTACSRMPVCQDNFGKEGDYVYIERSITTDASDVDRAIVDAI